MRICVAGLWHLGVVTAASVAAAGHRVVAFDEDEAVVTGLRNGVLPVDEPGLAELVRRGVEDGSLEFTDRRDEALEGADVVWIAYDTPVDADDRADVDFVVERARALVEAADPGAVILISSQLPVGTTGLLERSSSPRRTFAYSPENLRLGHAIAAFENPDRIVVGVRPDGDRDRVEELLGSFSGRIEWMGVESAELVKHGLNAFLALSVTFANELAEIAEVVGADASEVERGLKSERRIGARAYLRPGAAFSGGTLARDLDYLTQIGEREGVPTELLRAVRTSNDEHRAWARRTVESLVGGTDGRLDGHAIGVWGLVYKQGTDTLRRSSSVELCRALARAGANVRAHDPAVRTVPDDLSGVFTLSASPLEAAEDASALVVETDWPAYRDVDPGRLVASMRTALVVDANGFLREQLRDVAGVRYVRLGVPRVTDVLAGRAAIVTGGSHGLGNEIARTFLAAGARVLVCGRDAAALDRARTELESIAPDSAWVAAARADVSDPDAADAVVRSALERFSRVDVLVNNAGVYGPKGRVEDVAWDEWEQAIRVNLFGSVLCARAVLPHFRAQGYGKIIQLSGGGATSPLPRLSAYAASKAAVVRFTETLAEEVRGTGIDVNAIAPGALNTRLLDEVLEAGPEHVGDAFYERALEQRSGGGTSLDVAARLAVFLASSESDGITGKLISAPWDPWAELPSHADDLRTTDVYTLRRIVPADRGLAWG